MAAEFKACAVPGCNKNAAHSANGARGWCSAHYDRWRAHGDPQGGRTYKGEPEAFLRGVVIPCTSDDCLIWPFARSHGTYASISLNGRSRVVSRLVCEIAHGAPPSARYEAAHSCGKGHDGCVNPRHLSWKTMRDNQADRLIHGTHNRGERCGLAKLTEADIREIRTLAATHSRVELGKRFGVHAATIGKIASGKRWSYVQ